MKFIQITDKGIYITLHVQPGAKTTEWCGIHNEAMKIRLKAPATEGKANKTLVQFLSNFFKTPQALIQITKGLNSKRKVVFIAGLSEENLYKSLQPDFFDKVSK